MKTAIEKITEAGTEIARLRTELTERLDQAIAHAEAMKVRFSESMDTQKQLLIDMRERVTLGGDAEDLEELRRIAQTFAPRRAMAEAS